MKLFNEYTPEDLACRGFGQAEILAMCGVDTGYHTNSLRSVTNGIDRMQYKAEHVKHRVSQDVVDGALARYANAELDAVGVLDALGLANPTLCKLKKLFDILGMGDAFREADKKHRKNNMAAGMVDKYGVDNPFKLSEFQDKAVSTREERYGAAYTLAAGSSLAEDARATFTEHMQDDGFREELQAKKSAACMEHYGVEHPMQNEDVKAKAISTRVERSRVQYFANKKRKYGRTKKDFVREAHYVHGNKYDYSQVKFVDMATKVLVICPEHGGFWVKPTNHLLGARCPRCAGVVKKTTEQFVDEARLVHGDRYDYSLVEYDGVFGKVCVICPEHGEFWQVARDHIRGSGCPKCWKIKSRETSLKKYGTNHPMQSESVQAKARATNEERLGAPFPGQSLECRLKAIATNVERYGVASTMAVPSVRKKAAATRRNNGTFNASKPEELVYELLCDVFGFDDVVRQYSCDARYPYDCDFYIKSRDLFIELNGMWTHGPHWFGSDRLFDDELLAYWKDHAGQMYDIAVHTWTVSDVAKRVSARYNELNYVVFWDGCKSILDARLWFAMGCPDGRDWECEYSWLSCRDVKFGMNTPKLSCSRNGVIGIAKWANGAVFYAREMILWCENAYQRGWGTLQAQLYANRYKYLRSGVGGSGFYCGKLPNELSDVEILRGLGIMGKLRAYTAFDNTAMVDVIDRYGIKSVLDPCAGWGERMVTCIAEDIDYFGIDVNKALCDGYAKIVKQYGDSSRHKFVVGDSAIVEIEGIFDAVITCPPYGDIEIYTEYGAENLSRDDFAQWWQDVVANMSEHVKRYFCVQTNQAMREIFVGGIEACGWIFVEAISLSKKASHFTRKAGGEVCKREFEEMLVFGRESISGV